MFLPRDRYTTEVRLTMQRLLLERLRSLGSIENLSDKPMNNVALKIDFLDQTGNVVASQTAQLPSVAPKGSQSFTVNANKDGIVAFRYAPLPTS